MKVRDVIRLLESDGWRLREQKGSHRQYTHPLKAGRVTVPGKLGQDLAASQNREATLMKYAVVIERVPGSNYSAYVPDLPGCVSTGETIEEVKRNIEEAIQFHLEGMRADGEPIPEPTTRVDYAEVALGAPMDE